MSDNQDLDYSTTFSTSEYKVVDIAIKSRACHTVGIPSLAIMKTGTERERIGACYHPGLIVLEKIGPHAVAV